MKKCHCSNCGYSWDAQKDTPSRCPRCKTHSITAKEDEVRKVTCPHCHATYQSRVTHPKLCAKCKCRLEPFPGPRKKLAENGSKIIEESHIPTYPTQMEANTLLPSITREISNENTVDFHPLAISESASELATMTKGIRSDGQKARNLLTVPAILVRSEAVQVTDPKTNESKPAFEVILKGILSPEDFHILTGCLNGTQVTVQVQGGPDQTNGGMMAKKLKKEKLIIEDISGTIRRD